MSDKGNIQFFWVKVLVTVCVVGLALGLVYREVTVNHRVLFEKSYWDSFSLQNASFLNFHLLAFFLLFINWGIEAEKWRIIVSSIQQVKFGEAFRAVLCGLWVSLLAPRFVGESLGRVLHMSTENRNKAYAGLIISRLGQLLITTLIGLMAMIFYSGIADQSGYYYMSIAILLLLYIVTVYRKGVVKLLGKLIGPKYAPYLDLFIATDRLVLLKVVIWSALRYVVFVSQFCLIFLALNNTLDLESLVMGIAVFFLVRSLVVSVNMFVDYTVRIASALIVLIDVIGNPEDVILAVSIIWLINVLVPSLIGGFFMKGMKLNTVKHG